MRRLTRASIALLVILLLFTVFGAEFGGPPL